MNISDSSEYVKVRTVLLAEYFGKRGWLVTGGENNCIMFYVPDAKILLYSKSQLATIIGESDYHIKETGLRMSGVTYRFYHQGKLVNEIEVWPLHEFDLYTD